MRKLFYWITLTVFIAPSTCAQSNYSIEHIHANIKASVGNVTNTQADSLGRLWLGLALKGLAYYAGNEVVRLPLEGEEAFSTDPLVFYVGEHYFYLNHGEKVSVFNPIQEKVIQEIALEERDKLLKIHLLAPVLVEEQEWLWAVVGIREQQTKEEKLHLFLARDGKLLQQVTKQPIANNGFPILIPTKNQQILVKTANGFAQIDTTGKITRSYVLPPCDIQKIDARTCLLDESGKLWFAFNRLPLPMPGFSNWNIYNSHGSTSTSTDYRYGLYSLNLSDDQLILHQKFDFSVFRLYHHQNQLITSGNSKILFHTYQIQANRWEALHYEGNIDPQLTVNVSSLYKDQTGIIWWGTSGLGRLIPKPDLFKYVPLVVPRGIVEDKTGTIYAGGGGMQQPQFVVLDSNQQAIKYVEVEKEIYGLSIYKDQLIWSNIKTDLAINGRNPATILPDSVSDNPVILNYIDRNYRLWVKGWESSYLLLYDLEKSAVVKQISMPYTMESNAIYQRLSNGKVYLGTHSSGIFIFSEEGELLEHYTTSKDSKIQLASNTCSAFYENKAGDLWIGHGLGLSRINSSEDSIEHFELMPNEPYFNFVSGILPDDDDRFLWVGTNRGLYRFDTQTKIANSFPFHPEIQEVWFARVANFKSRSGRMYWGGSNAITGFQGIIHFNPNELLEAYDGLKKSNSPIFIKRYVQFDRKTKQEIESTQELQQTQSIILQAGDRYFNLEFRLADFRYPRQNYYSYYLEGYDENWRMADRGNATIHYENLPKGTYRLYLRGALFQDQLAQNEKVITVKVIPYWYETTWARILFVASGMIMIYGIYRNRLIQQIERTEAKQIKELDLLKTRLYTNITHEFRTPLTVILGMTEQLADGNARQLIRRNGKNLLRLVNQLLDLSKLDSGKLTLDKTNGDIIVYLQYLTESFHSMALEREIQLLFHSEEDALYMDFDEVKIQHIVYNLLSNALKFTPKGGKVVFLVLKAERKGVAYLKIKIKDTGIGIAATQLPHIFNRFYQVDNSTTRKGEGTGIGLALTKELVELMNGQINVVSTPGKGTEFLVWLPIENNMPPASPNPDYVPSEHLLFDLPKDELPANPTPAFSETGNSERPVVLIIEDNRDVATYIQQLLAKDYETQLAENGHLGIEKALESIPDIIISDVMMPEKSGYDVCETLKQDERTNHIPIILLTAKAMQEDKVEGLKYGADAFLVKPFDKEELFVRLEKLIALRQQLQTKYSQQSADISKPIDNPFLQKLRTIIAVHLDETEFGASQLAEEMAMSPTQLYRKLKALTGTTSTLYIRSIRLERAKKLLQTTALTISEIAYEVGFSDPNYFSRVFQQEFHSSPSYFRN